MCAAAPTCDFLFEYVNKSNDRPDLGGYRRDLLVKELTRLEEKMLICRVCGGVMRDDCFRQHEGKRRESVEPGVVGDVIAELMILCPLNNKGCEWVGVIPSAESHLEECEFKPKRCIFSEYGCSALIPLGKIEAHLQESSSEHLLQMLEQVRMCALQVERSGIEIERLRTQNQDLEESFRKEHLSLISQLNAAEISNRIRGDGFDWPLSDVTQKIEERASLWGPYFYIDGYKFQMKASFGYEGQSYLALFLCLVRGERDELLQWPFKLDREKFVFSLRKCSGSDTQLLTISTGDSSQTNFKRPDTSRNLARGTAEFVSHSELLSEYCQDNSCGIRVCLRPKSDPVDALRREVQALFRSQDIRGGGYLWRVEGVSQKIADKEDLWGPSFYVGRYLFHPTVRFFCNSSPNLGLFIALFKGPYDSELAWPFRIGSDKFHFAMLDRDNRESVTNSISVDEKNQKLFSRPDGPHNSAYGCPNFIPHKNLLAGSLLLDDSFTVKITIRSKS